MKNRILLLALASMLTAWSWGKTIYVATDGDDAAAGTIKAPLKSLPAACQQASAGDTVYFRGGTYRVTDDQIMDVKGNTAFVFALKKAGSENGRTCFMGYPGERPVFDFSALQLDGRHRFAAFYLGADYLHLRNFDIVGVPVRVKGHTQSECISARKGSHCIVENIAMYNNMAIGYYQTVGSHNLVLNCDAYNNYDDYSEGPYGGNVDGFGCHVIKPTDIGNTFRGCRAWRNSDDGFDLIHCQAPVLIDHCVAMYNGFRPTADPHNTTEFKSAGDGNGFKCGGWGMEKEKTRCIGQSPKHQVFHCVAYYNKANGIYANHHLSGNLWFNNTSAMNRRDNYNMVNRRSTEAGDNIDIGGYGHVLIGNVSWNPNKQDLSNCDSTRCFLSNNSFAPTELPVSESDFVSTDPALLFLPRDAEGNLPHSDFLSSKQESVLSQRNMGWQ